MKPPRAQLRSYLAEAFSDSFRLFVADYFHDARPAIPWNEGLATQADALIGWLDERARIAELWPVLGDERPQHAERIAQLAARWTGAARPGDELRDWLVRHAAELEAQLAGKLRGNPIWTSDARFIDIVVRERSMGKAGAARFEGTLEAALDAAERTVILVGDGGTGKTTILVHTAVALVRHALDHPGAPVPLYLRLNFFDATERGFDGLLDELARSSGLSQELVRSVWSGERGCWFLLDGLNEVRREFRDSCISAIEKLMRGRHRCIVTSRPTGDVDELVRRIAPITVLDVAPLTEGQIRAALGNHGLTAVADRLGDRLAGLAETPFLLSAIVRNYQGVDLDRLPSNVPQLYQALIDDHIFARRELTLPDDVRPTTYDYPHVKRPILAQLALRMRRDGVTRIAEDRALLGFVRGELERLRAAHDGERDVMPERPLAKHFVDEVVLNGILAREDVTLEFWHESVLDYYAGIALAALPPDELAALVPPLVWRRLEIRYDELPVPGAFTEAIAMHLGLAAGASARLPAIADHHPLVAARCIGVAGLHDTPEGRALMQAWSAQLRHRRSVRRWVACQCLLRAGNVDEATAHALVELALSDPETNVRQVAMQALSACAHVRPLEALVTGLIAHDGNSAFSDPGANLRRLRSAQVIGLLVDQRGLHPDGSRERTRIQRLLATMELEFVGDVLGRLPGAAAAEVLRGLPGWDFVGIDAQQMRHRAERVRAASERVRREHRARLAEASAADLEQVLRAGPEIERITALDLLDERKLLGVDALFDVMMRDPGTRVRSQARAALTRLPAEAWRARWEAAMADEAWTERARLPAALEAHLAPGAMSPAWLAALSAQGISGKNLACNTWQLGWLLSARSWSGEAYERELYDVRRDGSELVVHDLGARLRLAVLGGRLGDAALPALQRLIDEHVPYARTAVIPAWGEIGSDAAIALLAQQFLLNGLEARVVHAVAGSRHPAATRLLLDELGALPEPRHSDRLTGTSRIQAVTTALLSLGVADELYRFVAARLDGEPERRAVAALVLACAADAKVVWHDLVLRACADGDPRVRRIALTLLATTPDAGARDLLLRACTTEPVREVWTAACETFRRVCEDDDLARLRAARGDADRDIRARVIGALAAVRDDAALPDLRDALADPDGEIRVLAAGGLQQLGEPLPDAVLDELAAAVRSAPDPRVRAAAAQVLRGEGAFEARVYRPIQDAIEADLHADVVALIGDGAPFLADDPNLFWWRGWARIKLDQLELAHADLAESIRLGQTDAVPVRAIAFVLVKLGRRDEALDRMRDASEAHPDDADVWCERCDCALLAGRVDEALEAGERAVALAPSDVGIALSRAFALVVRDGDAALARIASTVDLARSALGGDGARQAARSSRETFGDLAEVWPDRGGAIRRALDLVSALDAAT